MTGGIGPDSGVLRVIVADDQASVREGLVVLLDLLPDIEVIASAANGQQALDLVAEHHPDAILLDLHMPGMDGTEAARLLTARHPDVAIVVLTTYADDTSIMAALRAGARSYLTKDADRTVIAQALHGAASGLSVLAPTAQATLLSAADAPPSAGAVPPIPAAELPAGLTARETEKILTLIARGLTIRRSPRRWCSAATRSRPTSTVSSPRPARPTGPKPSGSPARTGWPDR